MALRLLEIVEDTTLVVRHVPGQERHAEVNVRDERVGIATARAGQERLGFGRKELHHLLEKAEITERGDALGRFFAARRAELALGRSRNRWGGRAPRRGGPRRWHRRRLHQASLAAGRVRHSVVS
jgi:hypothetical protein